VTLREFLGRLAAWYRRDALDRDLAADLEAHVELLARELEAGGLSRAAARTAARRQVGNLTGLRERSRDAWGFPGFEALVRDVRFAARRLRRDAGMTFFAIVIGGLGIGASTTVFSLCDALLLRPLPVREPERLVWISNGTSENLSEQTAQVANLEAMVERGRSFEGIAGFSPFYGPGDIRLTGDGEPERVTGVPVTQTFFPLLGIRPEAGRLFDQDEARDGAPRTAMLGHRFWVRRFGRDPGVVGRTITLDGVPVRVIGVLPASFDFEQLFTPGRTADLFTPYPLSPETNRRGNTLALVGRLKPGVTLDAAQAELTAITARLPAGRTGDTWRNAMTPVVGPLRDHVSGRFTSALYVLAGAVAFLMLLVYGNVANLLLVRASVRRKEMALRAALGASGRHLRRQMLAESLVLCAGAAALGIVVAVGATSLVSRLQDTSIPLLSAVRVDGGVLAFTIALTLVTGIGFGILPALQAAGLARPAALADESRGSTGGLWSGKIRRAVAVGEVALVCVLLAGAGLLLRSFTRVLDVQPGFTTDNVIALRVDPVREGSTTRERRAYLDQLVRAVRGLPQVAATGLTDALPLGDNSGWRRWSVQTPELPREETREIEPLVRMVDAGYFATLRIPLRSGRAFTDADVPGSEPVIIVNERLADALWPGADPIGRTLTAGGTERRVVGVAAATRYFSLDRPAEPEMYMPVGHPGGFSSVDLVVRGEVPPATLITDMRAALRRADPSLPTANVRTMEQLVDHSLFARRFVVLLVGAFGVFGLLLAALGLYAVISYSVSQRTQEIAIRMALGASAGGVAARILRETGRLAVAGVAIGLPLSLATTRALRGLLFGVVPTDPVTFAAVLAVLGGVVALAGYLPARRATQVDPGIALKPH